MTRITLVSLLFLSLLSMPSAAAGLPGLNATAYADRACGAIETGLAGGDIELAEEFVSLLETGAYDRHAPLRRAMVRRVSDSLSSRAAESGTASIARMRQQGLQELLERIRKAPTKAVQARAIKPLRLPADEAGHLTLAEWWYLNGHLADEAGRPYGYELCFFRVRPGIYFAHVAITDVEGKQFYRLRKYYSPLECRTPRDRLDLAYGDRQSLLRTGNFEYKIAGDTGTASLELALRSIKTPMLVNGNGLIDMPEGTFSYYYSMTRLATEGHLTVGGRTFRVTGLSWMDHQWGNFVTIGVGWDWFSAQLADGRDFNIFCFRKGNRSLAQFVNCLDASGQLTSERGASIKRLAWWKSPTTGHKYVTHFQVSLSGDRTLDIKSRLDDQEMPGHRLDPAPTYWEGKCQAVMLGADPVEGLSYCEQFPYPEK
jgi:predicted secreted hydrolase